MKRRLTATLLLPGAATFVLVCGCPQVLPPGPGCAGENESCTTTDDCCEDLECMGGTCGTAPSGTQAAIPAKSIDLGLIGIHDPGSDAHNDNCIGCHGDRSDEVALDGVTPGAHATMGDLFGEGNDRCVACHDRGPDFLTASAGGLRAQVDIEAVGCGNCHGATAALALYAE